MRNKTNLLLLCFWSALFCRLLALQVASPLSCAASNTSSSSSTSVCIDNDIPSVNALRGGDGGGNVAVLDDVGVDNKTRDVILRFLHYTDNNNLRNVKFDDFTFHIQGWRWHFMSLIRDSRRLERLSSHLTNILADETLDDDCISESAAGLDALHRAANYVINFNMAGLYRIQSGMFLSFLRDHLCEIDSLRSISGGGEGQDVTAEIDAFRKTIGKIDDYRVQSEIIGRELVRACRIQNGRVAIFHRHL